MITNEKGAKSALLCSAKEKEKVDEEFEKSSRTFTGRRSEEGGKGKCRIEQESKGSTSVMILVSPSVRHLYTMP